MKTLHTLTHFMHPLNGLCHLVKKKVMLFFILRVTTSWILYSFRNKNAFQWDAFRPLADRIPACIALGVSAQEGCVFLRGVCPGRRGRVGGWVCPGGSAQGGGRIPACNGADTTLPRGQTDTCENITFANFVCGR